MKVTIETKDEKFGLLFKTTEYALYVKVELSQEERAAIENMGIENYVLMEYSYKGVEVNYKVKSVVYASDKGHASRFVASDAIVRDEMEAHIMQQLKALKSQIAAQLEGGPGSRTVEL